MDFQTQQSEVAARLRLNTSDANQLTLVKRWLNQSQQDIWSRYDWPWALSREVVQTVADKKGGTVAISANDTTVTGTSTSFASGDAGKFIQFSNTDDWYKITAVASTTSLTIEKAYVGTSALSGGTYTIRQFFYSLSSSVEKVMSIHQAITPAQLELVPFKEFYRHRPDGESTSSPLLYALFGYDSSNNWQFTPYPWPDAILNLEVRFKKKAADLSANADTSLIPTKWSDTVMIDGALYRGLEYVETKAEGSRSEIKRRQFEEGIRRMIEEAEAESDYHPVLDSKEVRVGIDKLMPLPPEFDRRP